MMFITRSVVARQAGRSLGRVAFAALLVAVGVLFAAVSAEADPDSPPNVYHSPGDTGLDTRSEFPPGCVPAGEGEATAAAAPSDPVELITNGGFEVEGLDGWIVIQNEDSFPDGSFYSATGTSPPISFSDGRFPSGAHDTVGPSEGDFYAVSDQTGSTSTALSQVFTVPAGASSVVLTYEMFVNDWWPSDGGTSPVVNEGYLELVSGNQFATVDILTADAFALDPFTDDVVQNLYPPGFEPSLPNPYTPYEWDLTTALGAGGNFVLRFAQIDAIWFMNLGVDNVSLLVDPDGQEDPLDCVVQGGSDEELFLFIDGGDVATSTGTECKMDDVTGANGEELCAADVQISLLGFGVFTDFFMDSDPGMETLVWHPNCLPATCDAVELFCAVGVCNESTLMCDLPAGCDGSPSDLPSEPPTDKIRMNFRRGDQTDIAAGVRRLGMLVLDSTPPDEGTPVDTRVLVAGMAGIGAKLQVRNIAAGGIAPEVIAQPAPAPEPGAMAQIVSGLVGLGMLQRMRRRRISG
jgi:hypothetical protein